MGGSEKVGLELKPERWGEELRPLLARVATGKRAARWMSGVVGALERGDAVAFVARAASPAPGDASPARPLALLVLAFKKWPMSAVHVLAMSAVPRSGFAWGPAFVAKIAALARSAGAEELEAEALTEAQRRRLERIGFLPRSRLMVLPC